MELCFSIKRRSQDTFFLYEYPVDPTSIFEKTVFFSLPGNCLKSVHETPALLKIFQCFPIALRINIYLSPWLLAWHLSFHFTICLLLGFLLARLLSGLLACLLLGFHLTILFFFPPPWPPYCSSVFQVHYCLRPLYMGFFCPECSFFTS